jgi:hypothetical protein
MQALTDRLAGQLPVNGEPMAVGRLLLFWTGLLPRKLVFLALVLLHGF